MILPPENTADQTGWIFDIQRTSLHDGPGIRTTVFFKGCPLHCAWCHNPESRSYRPQMAFNREKCADCFACVEACQHGAQQALNGVHSMDHTLCQACGACLAACPNDALKMIGEPWSVAQIMAEVGRDRAFYAHSGGGVTLSGGEPMAQLDFALAILRSCRANGIHTCVETSGFAPRWKFQSILPWVDLFLLDYKLTDADAHIQWTGVTNDLILDNLDYLYAQGGAILLRCPLIPGVNDTPDHLAGIAAISQAYPHLQGIELMAYHNLGRDKSARLGTAYPLEGIPTTGESTQQAWLQALAVLGCTRAVMG